MGLNVKEKIDGVVTPELKKKVAAWWQGVGVDDLDWPVEGAEGEGLSSEDGDAEPEEAKPEITVDLSHYIKVSEMLWGKGYVTPGGKHFIDLWGQQLSLNKEKSTAFMGAGLGGQARELNLSTGSWVTCFERHAELIEVAADESMMAGLAKKVTSQYYDPEKFELEAEKFSAVVAKEEFTTIENKQGAIEAIYGGLKRSGMFMFTVYTANSPDLDAEAVTKFFGEMQGIPNLWTEGQYVEAVEKVGLDIHVNEDLSDKYIEFINAAWGGYRTIVDKIKSSDETDLEKASLLMMVGISAEQWTHIAMALGAGDLQIRRFLARKK